MSSISLNDLEECEKIVPMFSVVITTYKRPEGLRNALTSVDGQTDRDFEVIIMNNDTDTAHEVDEVVAGFDLPIRVFHNQENLGQSGSRNRGVEHASAEIVALLDDDDTWLPTFLEEHRSRHEADSGLSLVYSGHFVVWNDLPLAPRVRPAVPPPEGDLFTAILRGEFVLAANSILTIKRSEYLELGGYDPKLSGFPDWDFQLRLAQIGRFGHVTEPLVNFGFHLSGRDSDPIRRRPELASVSEKWAAYDGIERFVRKTKLDDLYRASFASVFTGDRAGGFRHLAVYAASGGPGWTPRLLGRLLVLNGLGPKLYTRLQRRANPPASPRDEDGMTPLTEVARP